MMFGPLNFSASAASVNLGRVPATVRPFVRGGYCAVLVGWCLASAGLSTTRADDSRQLIKFERTELTNTYYSEGANAGDLNGDGRPDAVYGPYWYEGPEFKTRHELYPPQPQNMEGYADNFFSWIYDANRDGRNDVFVVGFPGTPAYVYENPGASGWDKHWPKHEVFDWVSNESPHFTNLVGDETPELVCTRDGFFGYATINSDQPLSAWTFRTISDRVAADRFGHGLGVGDVDGDGRLDILAQNGWFQQPADLTAARWPFHEFMFTDRGGAEMYAYDVDGDGDNDVITSLAAHDFGLSWFEQVREGDRITFKPHLIMGERRSQNRYGVLFTELHSVNLQDIDGDGLKDIVTGKTYWSHHRQSPLWDAGPVVYWFRLVRGPQGVDFVPYQADGEAGIGRELSVTDVNGDGLLDLVVGGMRGAHVLIQKRVPATEAEWNAAQPQVYTGPDEPATQAAPAGSTERVSGALEGEELKVSQVSAGQANTQVMTGFTKGKWSNGAQLFWTGGQPGAQLELAFQVSRPGRYRVTAVMTKAPDYGQVQFLLDGHRVGGTHDLFEAQDVVTTGTIELANAELAAGDHHLSVKLVGKHPAAVASYLFGLDYVQLSPQ